MDLRTFLHRNGFKILLCLTLVVFAVEFLWVFCAEHALNKYLTVQKISQIFDKNEDIDSTLDGIKFETHADFSISVNISQIKILHSGEPMLFIDNGRVRFYVLPILANSISIKSASADKFFVKVVKNKLGRFNFEYLLNKKNRLSKTPKLSNISAVFNGYDLSYVDESVNQSLTIKGTYLNLKKYRAEKEVAIETAGVLKFKDNVDTAKFDINFASKLPFKKNISNPEFDVNLNLQNLQLKPFSPFAKYVSFSEVESFDGKINAEIKTEKINESHRNKRIFGNIITQNLLLKEKLEENTSFLKERAVVNFETYLSGGNLSVRKFSLKTPYHEVDIDGKISHINSSKPLLDLRLKLYNDIRSMIYNAIPSEINYENCMIAKIKKYNPKAALQGELRLNGDFKTPDIFGEINTDNLFIDLPVANEAKAKLKLIFDKKRMRVLADVVPNEGARVNVDGSLNIYGEKNAVFDIKSSEKVKLTVVKAVLTPIQDVFSLNFGILNQILLKGGYGNADLHFSGTRKNAKVFGPLNFESAVVSLNGVNAVLDNVLGQLEFKEKDVVFSTKKAFLYGDELKINGTADLAGNFDVNMVAPTIKTQSLLNILNTSDLLKTTLKNYEQLQLIRNVGGKSDAEFNIKGKSSIDNGAIDMAKIKYSGTLNIKNNDLKIKKFPHSIRISNASVNFDNNSVTAVSNIKILKSDVNFDVKIDNDDLHVYSTSKKFSLSDIFLLSGLENIYGTSFSKTALKNSSSVSFEADYKGKTDKIDLDNINLTAKLFYDSLVPQNKNALNLYATQGLINLKNGNATINKVNFSLFESTISLDGVINNLFSKKPDYELDFSVNNFDLSALNTLNTSKIIGENVKKVFSAYENYKGKVNGQLKMRQNSIDGKLFVRNIGLTHKKMRMPIYLSSADMNFSGTTMTIKSMNGAIDDVPVFFSIKIDDILKKPIVKGYTTSNLYPSFVNKYVNANLGYPIKLKGEMAVKANFEGNLDAIKSSTVLVLPVGSDVSYMGASLDEEEFERELKLEMTQKQNLFSIKNATLSKYITSQSGTRTKYPYIKLSGDVNVLNDKIEFNKLNIKTLAKTSSGFFNVLFKKSVLKYGDFECDLQVDGNTNFPKILGFIKFKNLDMPLYETIVKDIFADFKPGAIELKILGNVYDTNISAIANLENRLSAPYKIRKLDVKADYLDLEKIFNSISKVAMPSPHKLKNSSSENIENIEPSMFLIDKGKVTAKKILVKGFPATDMNVEFRQGKDSILRVDDFDFKIAEGTVTANGYYDFATNTFNGNCIAKSIDANKFTQIFLNLKNQIYGSLDGTVDFTTQGALPDERLKNLRGRVTFNINDGKMPKLGSLEYLLKAANVVKSGFTGFTINSIIELLVPIRTGDFSIIKGEIFLEDGLAKDIKLYSRGKNLSLYITGQGDIVNQHAKMLVYGRLSKKISTLLGPIGNTSINTLFNFIPGVKLKESESIIFKELNKVPGLDFSADEYRFFRAEIDGNINGENYVQSFKWLE